LTVVAKIIFYRWLSEAGVKVASEKQWRLLSKELISTEVAGEVAPFTRYKERW